MSKRALRIAIPVFVVCLVAGSVAAFFAGNGSLSGGEWETASGVSLQVPTAGAPQLVFTAQPAPRTAFQAAAGVFSVAVTIEDSHGTPLGDGIDTVTLRLQRDPGGGTLSCTNAGGLTVTVYRGPGHLQRLLDQQARYRLSAHRVQFGQARPGAPGQRSHLRHHVRGGRQGSQRGQRGQPGRSGPSCWRWGSACRW